jgi:hypothetical protein
MTNVHGGPTVSKLTPRYPARRFKGRHLPSSLWKTNAHYPHMLFLMQYVRHVRKRCSGNETMSSSHSGFGGDAIWSRRFELDQTLQALSRSSKAVNKHSPAAASFSASCLRNNHLPSGVMRSVKFRSRFLRCSLFRLCTSRVRWRRMHEIGSCVCRSTDTRV